MVSKAIISTMTHSGRLLRSLILTSKSPTLERTQHSGKPNNRPAVPPIPFSILAKEDTTPLLIRSLPFDAAGMTQHGIGGCRGIQLDRKCGTQTNTYTLTTCL